MNRITPRDVRHALLTRTEVCLLDLRPEDEYAQGHPLFAAQLPPERITVEAPVRLPRRDVPIVLYDAGEGRVEAAADELRALGYDNVAVLDGGPDAWRAAGYELFRDVNSYSKAFGELVEHRRGTPSIAPAELLQLLGQGSRPVILDARRFDEYATMSIPGGISAPGAELVLRASAAAPSPDTLVVVNCAGRTRSIIGAQSLINAGLPNPVRALRNGTIGWSLAGYRLETGRSEEAPEAGGPVAAEAGQRAREVADRAGVIRLDAEDVRRLARAKDRTLYRFDVRLPAAYARGHIPGFLNVQGGQLVQETDHHAPVRGARVVLADDLGIRADMTASWLAQMGIEAYVLDGGFDGPLEDGPGEPLPPRGPEGRYRRPYEGTNNPVEAMRAYLEWEFGLVEQLARDGTHGFRVI